VSVVAPEPLRDAAIVAVKRATLARPGLAASQDAAEDLVDTLTAHIVETTVVSVLAELRRKGVIPADR
jgi:hypothetical protein